MAEPSRVETILMSMLGLAEEIPKPQSRVEELLIDLKQAIDGGGSGDMAEIVGRVSTLETDVGRIKMVDDAQNEVLDELNANKVGFEDYPSIMSNYGIKTQTQITEMQTDISAIEKKLAAAVVSESILQDGANLNTVIKSGIYRYSQTGTGKIGNLDERAGQYGNILVINPENKIGYITQVVFPLSETNGKIFIRGSTDGGTTWWKNWKILNLE